MEILYPAHAGADAGLPWFPPGGPETGAAALLPVRRADSLLTGAWSCSPAPTGRPRCSGSAAASGPPAPGTARGSGGCSARDPEPRCRTGCQNSELEFVLAFNTNTIRPTYRMEGRQDCIQISADMRDGESSPQARRRRLEEHACRGSSGPAKVWSIEISRNEGTAN